MQLQFVFNHQRLLQLKYSGFNWKSRHPNRLAALAWRMLLRPSKLVVLWTSVISHYYAVNNGFMVHLRDSVSMMLERFGDNLTVTTSDISKLTHFPPEWYVSLLLYNPLVVYQKERLLESLLSDWRLDGSPCSKKQRWTCIKFAIQ